MRRVVNEDDTALSTTFCYFDVEIIRDCVKNEKMKKEIRDGVLRQYVLCHHPHVHLCMYRDLELYPVGPPF